MVDSGGEPGLAKLCRAHLFERLRAALEQLDDDWSLQKRVRGEIDDARAAGADLANDLVVLNGAALHSPLSQVRQAETCKRGASQFLHVDAEEACWTLQARSRTAILSDGNPLSGADCGRRSTRRDAAVTEAWTPALRSVPV